MATLRPGLALFIVPPVLFVPAPAHAGGVDPCNADFQKVAAAPLVTSSGVKVGRMRLLAKPGTKEFCGQFRVSDDARASDNRVVVGLGVASADQDSGLAHSQFTATHVLPLVIDAHGYPKGSTVTYRVVFKGDERVTGVLTAPVR